MRHSMKSCHQNMNKCQVFESKLGCLVLNRCSCSSIYFPFKCLTLHFFDLFFPTSTSYIEVGEQLWRSDIQNKSNGAKVFSADLLVHGAVIAPPTLCHTNDKIIM